MDSLDLNAKKSSWRSSNFLVIFTATLGLFTENFLYSFIVPLMPYMFEVRLHEDPKYTQKYSSGLLFILGAVAMVGAPPVGHLADKVSDRKIPLLFALALSILGTALVAATLSVWSVFVGRVFQGISSTAAWIISFAMLTDHIPKKHYGKILGVTSSFLSGGVLIGPAVGGTLLEWVGYWPAWTVPFTLLVIVFLARLVMFEQRKPSKSVETRDQIRTDEVPSEQSALLATENSPASPESTPETKVNVQQNFYKVMLTTPSVIAGLLNVIVFSLQVSAFDATFPLHLRRTFDWGSAAIGLVFLAIQVPGAILAPAVGWMRDRVGLRWPAAIGWGLQAPLIWFAGVPGTLDLPGLETKTRQENAFVICVIIFGIVSVLSRGSGTFQNTITLREIQDKNPGIFGPHGGSSRLFAMTEVAFNIGLMLGPIIGGALADTVGFYWMMFTLAVLCLIVATTSALFLKDQRM